MIDAIRRLQQRKIRDEAQLIERAAGGFARRVVLQEREVVVHNVIIAHRPVQSLHVTERLVGQRADFLRQPFPQLLSHPRRDAGEVHFHERADVEGVFGGHLEARRDEGQQRARSGVAQLDQARGRDVPGGRRLLARADEQHHVGVRSGGVQLLAERAHHRQRQRADAQTAPGTAGGQFGAQHLAHGLRQFVIQSRLVRVLQNDHKRTSPVSTSREGAKSAKKS